MELQEENVFTGVCQSFCPWGDAYTPLTSRGGYSPPRMGLIPGWVLTHPDILSLDTMGYG